MTPSPFVARWNEVTSSEHVAIEDAHESVTFRELGRRAALGHRVLSGAGTAHCEPLTGRRIALLAAQGAGWVEAFAAVVTSGGIAVPLSPLYPPAELAYFVNDADADTIVVSRDLRERATQFAAGRRIVTIDELRAPSGNDAAAELPEGAGGIPRADDVALMLYTSGTTGRPKGALITHANLAVQAALLHEAWGWNDGDVLLHALPLHHLHGLGISLMTALLGGAKARMLEKFDAAAVWENMHRSTVFMGVPTMYQKLFDALDAADSDTRTRWTEGARSLRLATSGSAALPVKMSERWRALSGQYPLERFGMTEIGVGMTNPLHGERRAGSVGSALNTVDLRVVDEQGRDVGADQPGEIWIRGPSVFKGYWRRDDATAASFTDGWFRTGDMASRDAAGYVRILGRTSVDILKSGGYKLSALEIEDALREHDAIAEVAVIGLPDETWGEMVVAAIVARPGRDAEIDDARLRAWAKERLAPYKVPRRFIAMSSLPRNPVGKVLKPELARMVVKSG